MTRRTNYLPRGNLRPVLLTGLAAILAGLATSSSAHAATITFAFDYYTIPPHTSPHTPIPGGPFGTLTLTDSAVDPLRVDINLTIDPPAAYADAGLERFYLNFDSSPDVPPVPNDPDFLTNHQFYLVSQSAPAGSISPVLGTVGYTNGSTNYEFADFIFDLSPNATSSASTFVGSVTLRNLIANTFVDLDVSMFKITSVLAGTQTIPMYAAYRTHVANPAGTPTDQWPDGEFWAFASPEPATLGLLALGGLAIICRRRRPACGA